MLAVILYSAMLSSYIFLKSGSLSSHIRVACRAFSEGIEVIIMFGVNTMHKMQRYLPYMINFSNTYGRRDENYNISVRSRITIGVVPVPRYKLWCPAATVRNASTASGILITMLLYYTISNCF